MAIITNVCQNYSNFTWGYHHIWMLQLLTVLNGKHGWTSWFFIISEAKSSDAAAVQVAWNITEVCSWMLCICQMAFKEKQLCFPLSFQMTLTKYTQSASSGDEGCAGTLRWDFMLQWEWFLKLTAKHMESTQCDRCMFPRDSAQRWR